MISFDIVIERGTFVVKAQGTLQEGITTLMGPSGSGKSTFLKALCGLLTPKEGRITANNEVWFEKGTGVPTQERHIGYMPQGNIVFPHLSVEHNITYSKRGTSEMCDSLLKRLGLEKYRKTKAGSLSGGEQQRVALGRALYSKPTILLLDEPLSALDWNLRKHVREDLVSIIREWDVPCVWVTHDESEAEMVGNRHWTCEDGLIVRC